MLYHEYNTRQNAVRHHIGKLEYLETVINSSAPFYRLKHLNEQLFHHVLTFRMAE